MKINYKVMLYLPRISVIILNYNGKNFLKENLYSVSNQSYSNIEIIVVDNGSKDNSVKFIKDNFTNVIIIQNKLNLGFSANNLGIEISTGDYILILNNDTFLHRKMIEEAVKILLTNSNIGMLSPKILTKNDPQIIDSIGLRIYKDGMSRQRGRLERDEGQYDQVEEIFVPSGCAAFYKKEMLDEIGLIDIDFFAYCEDTDLGFRGRLADWKAYSCPESKVYHVFSGFWNKFSEKKAFFVERNHFWFALKCFPFSMLIKVPIYSLYRYIIQIYGFIFNKGIGGNFIRQNFFRLFRLAIIFFKAYIFFIIGIPKMLKKRRIIQKNCKIKVKEIKKWFKKYPISIQEIILKK